MSYTVYNTNNTNTFGNSLCENYENYEDKLHFPISISDYVVPDSVAITIIGYVEYYDYSESENIPYANNILPLTIYDLKVKPNQTGKIANGVFEKVKKTSARVTQILSNKYAQYLQNVQVNQTNQTNQTNQFNQDRPCDYCDSV